MPNRTFDHLRELLVRVGVERGDRGDALEDARGLLPNRRQLLAVPAPRREELHQHHPIRVQHLHPQPKFELSESPQVREADPETEGKSVRGGVDRETLDLKLLGLNWRTGEPAE